MLIREAAPPDCPAIGTLLEFAFARRAEAALVEALRASGEARIELVAEDGVGVIGHVMLSQLTAPFPALGLAPVAVAAASRRRGVASALIRRGLAEAEGSGWRGVFVFGAPGFYRRFCFDADLAKDFSTPYAGPHFMAAPLGDGMPASTGVIAYPAAFGALE